MLPVRTEFFTDLETPIKAKTASIPRQVKVINAQILKEDFHSELGDSILDEESLALSTDYEGHIISDCWLPNRILPPGVVPDMDLLTALTGPDGQPLYDNTTKQWNPCYLPPMLRKEGGPRLRIGEEEKGLSTFMGIVTDALTRHFTPLESATADTPPTSNTNYTASAPTTPARRESKASSPDDPSSEGSDMDDAASLPRSVLGRTASLSPIHTSLSLDDTPSTPPTSVLSETETEPLSPIGSPSPLLPTTEGAPSAPITATFATATTPTMTTHNTPSCPDPFSNPDISTALRTSRQRYWSSSTATKPLAGAQFKPDCVLVRHPKQEAPGTLSWNHVLMTAELTSKGDTLSLTSQMERSALKILDSQPDRAFCYVMSFALRRYRLCMYDRAGGVHSRMYNIHESPLHFLRILCATTFAHSTWFGEDNTFNSRLHPIITVDGERYVIIGKCFSSSVIRGRATTVWFVSKFGAPDGKEVFVIKDSWVNVERKLSEEQILETLKDIDCVPKVCKSWTVRRDNQEDSTSLRCPKEFLSRFRRACDHRVRRRLVLTPAGRPISHAANPLEVVTCVLDLVIAHKNILKRGILHRDISINNSMMYEELLANGTVRVRGLLIDFDYAIRVDELNRTAGPGDRTGTVPFMAIELLRTAENQVVRHTAAHDLESFAYLLCWVATIYGGPHSQLRTQPARPERLDVEGWYEASDWTVLANNKQGCMSSLSHINDITEYYECLSSCVEVLSDLVHKQRVHIQKKAKPTRVAVNYLTRSKRRRSEDHEDEEEVDPLNHDTVIDILHRACLIVQGDGVVPKGSTPDPILEPYVLTKTRRTVLLVSMDGTILDLAGGHIAKKRRVMRRQCGPARTEP